MSNREGFAGRLGFLFLSAGCAIGLGNIWRFPFICGQYGGGIFLCAYIFFLFAMGLPVLIMEYSVGRAARLNMGRAMHALEPAGSKWHLWGMSSILGNYCLMMFYMPVAGWMLAYFWYTLSGKMAASASDVPGVFGGLLADPLQLVFWTVLTSATAFIVCSSSLQKGAERIVKYMMAGLLLIMIGLAGYAVTLPGAAEGLKFYLVPDIQRALDAGVLSMLNEAMNQAFFTLSVGIGSMCIFGSYMDRKYTITKEAYCVVGFDTFAALFSGLIIFSVCFAFGVKPDAGPGLIFVTMPNVFNTMPGGRFIGTLFFVFMSAAAVSTVIAVVENIVSYFIDVYGWSRKKSALVNGIVLTVLTLPCIFGFNIWSGFQPFGEGSCVLDLEDFILSNNFLPLGGLLFCLFCCHRFGWGWDNFTREADSGEGAKFPKFLRFYLQWIMPAIFLIIFAEGYVRKFF